MKYTLNETKTRTSNNFKINDLKIDLDIIEKELSRPLNTINYSIKNNFDSKIGLKHTKYNNIDINVENDTDLINVDYDIDDTNYLVDQININLKDKTNSNIIICYKGNGFHNLKLILNAKELSVSNISVINMIASGKSFISYEAYMDESSSININHIDLGGELKVTNYYSELNGKNSSITFNNIYTGKNNDRIDMNYYSYNKNINTDNKINVYGLLNDNSYKTFKGTIDFVKGSTKSVGEEAEDVILLSDKAISTSLPMLLCHEDDVVGAHGVSTGKIDGDKLFYLMSKGLDYDESKKLIIMANFNKVINNIKDDYKNQIIDYLDKEI